MFVAAKCGASVNLLRFIEENRKEPSGMNRFAQFFGEKHVINVIRNFATRIDYLITHYRTKNQ